MKKKLHFNYIPAELDPFTECAIHPSTGEVTHVLKRHLISKEEALKLFPPNEKKKKK